VSNLPGLWRRLPDNFYRVYQVQENGTLRLVTQGYVQGGLLVDPNDKNETQDRPPTSQREAQPDTPVLAQSLPTSELAIDPVVVLTTPLSSELTWQPESAIASPADLLESPIAPVLVNVETLPKSAFVRTENDLQVQDRRSETEQSHLATAAALAPVLAAGVGIAASKISDPWETEVDRALAKLPADWSRTRALWRVRKPR